VADKVSLRYLTRHGVLPLSIQDGKLNVLVADAGQADVLAELSRLYGVPTSPCIGEPAKIAEVLSALAENKGAVRTGSSGAVQYHRITEVADGGKAAAEIVDAVLARGSAKAPATSTSSRCSRRCGFASAWTAAWCTSPTTRGPTPQHHLAHQGPGAGGHRRAPRPPGRPALRAQRVRGHRLRASFYVTVFGENAVLRILRKTKALVGLEQMGLSPGTLKTFVEDVLDPATGIVLVTGPTGSGKTTTLYAAVERLNDHSKKIITCEDPVEYVIDGITQCSVASRPGITFVDSLRSIVRQDPDIILIGEIRDRESADMAMQSALTGHKVLTTLHTEDAVSALVRLTEMGIEPYLIASTVTAVLAQRLVRVQCPHCRADYVPSSHEVRALSLSRTS